MKKEYVIMVMISVVSAVSAWGITRMLSRRMGRVEYDNDDFRRRGRLSGFGAGNREAFDDDGFSRRNRILAGAGVGGTL